MELQLVRQRGRKDCGVATIATLLGIPYESVWFFAPESVAESGGVMTGPSVRATLQKATGEKWRPRVVDPPVPLAECRLPDVPCMLLIFRDGEKYGHAIAVVDGIVYDSGNSRPAPVRTYRKRHWLVLWTMTQKKRSKT